MIFTLKRKIFHFSFVNLSVVDDLLQNDGVMGEKLFTGVLSDGLSAPLHFR